MSTSTTIREAVTPKELHALHEAGQAVDLIDVRTPPEFRELHATIARLEPIERLDPQRIMQARGERAAEPLYLICRSGSRARQAQEAFRKAGFDNTLCVEGGMQAWEQAGLPVVRGKKAVSLERQVRIAAGSLVLLGTLLGAFVHPAFLVVAGFVGAGLVFSGVTDTCGMAMLLARMPWNQASCGTETGCR
jgi:rhodanese-related sulfurtransferase